MAGKIGAGDNILDPDRYGGIGITGTPRVTHQDATDQLFVNGGAGNDNASAVVAGSMTICTDASTLTAFVLGLVLAIVLGLKFGH
jgi:hypothetical protein